MLLSILLLIVGFVILIKGADVFVDGASCLARNFKLSAMFIGLTIVAFGTSAPELAVSIQSLLKGNGEIILGNVIGSNIMNVLLILGISSLFHSLNVKDDTVHKELPITLLLSALLILLINDQLFGFLENNFTRQDGIVLILFFTVFIYYLIIIMKNKVNKDENEPIKYNIPVSIFYIIIGLICVILGSNYVVDSATNIATQLGVSQRMIALTIVALGTSLPELVTSITATRKGEYDIAIGNVVGSNIFNIGLVLGIPVGLFGGIEHIAINTIDLLILFVAALILFLFAFKDRKLNRGEGIVMLILFIFYYSYVIFCYNSQPIN